MGASILEKPEVLRRSENLPLVREPSYELRLHLDDIGQGERELPRSLDALEWLEDGARYGERVGFEDVAIFPTELGELGGNAGRTKVFPFRRDGAQTDRLRKQLDERHKVDATAIVLIRPWRHLI